MPGWRRRGCWRSSRTARIDFSQSQVYTQADRGSEVFVNLRGREPMGIVPAADYARVQEAIMTRCSIGATR